MATPGLPGRRPCLATVVTAAVPAAPVLPSRPSAPSVRPTGVGPLVHVVGGLLAGVARVAGATVDVAPPSRETARTPRAKGVGHGVALVPLETAVAIPTTSGATAVTEDDGRPVVTGGRAPTRPNTGAEILAVPEVDTVRREILRAVAPRPALQEGALPTVLHVLAPAPRHGLAMVTRVVLAGEVAGLGPAPLRRGLGLEDVGDEGVPLPACAVAPRAVDGVGSQALRPLLAPDGRAPLAADHALRDLLETPRQGVVPLGARGRLDDEAARPTGLPVLDAIAPDLGGGRLHEAPDEDEVGPATCPCGGRVGAVPVPAVLDRPGVGLVVDAPRRRIRLAEGPLSRRPATEALVGVPRRRDVPAGPSIPRMGVLPDSDSKRCFVSILQLLGRQAHYVCRPKTTHLFCFSFFED